MKNRLLKKADILIILVLILAAGLFWIWKNSDGGELRAVISVDGKTVQTVDLDKTEEPVIIRPETGFNIVIVAENGTIRFENSDCPDKLCVQKGKLYRKGDTAVCLPAKTVITVTGSGLDAVTY